MMMICCFAERNSTNVLSHALRQANRRVRTLRLSSLTLRSTRQRQMSLCNLRLDCVVGSLHARAVPSFPLPLHLASSSFEGCIQIAVDPQTWVASFDSAPRNGGPRLNSVELRYGCTQLHDPLWLARVLLQALHARICLIAGNEASEARTPQPSYSTSDKHEPRPVNLISICFQHYQQIRVGGRQTFVRRRAAIALFSRGRRDIRCQTSPRTTSVPAGLSPQVGRNIRGAASFNLVGHRILLSCLP